MSRFVFSVALLSLVGLTACEEPLATTPVAGAAPASAPATGQVPGPNAVPIDRAVSLFVNICAGTQPRFEGAEARMAAQGIDQPSPSGASTRYSGTENLSFRVMTDGPDRCSMVFGTNDDVNLLVTEFGKQINPLAEIDGALVSVYQSRHGDSLIQIENIQPNSVYGQTIVNIVMFEAIRR